MARVLSQTLAEYEDLEAERLSTRHAVNFAMTAWHLSDWLWATELKKNNQLQESLFGRTFGIKKGERRVPSVPSNRLR